MHRLLNPIQEHGKPFLACTCAYVEESGSQTREAKVEALAIS